MTKATVLATTLFLLSTCNAFADQGVPSASILDEMGLSGIEVLSDADAMAIRGKGYRPRHSRSTAIAGGISLAGVGSDNGLAGSVNFYLAKGNRSASGHNDSYAGTTVDVLRVKSKKGHKTMYRRTVVTKQIYAGGSSAARAH